MGYIFERYFKTKITKPSKIYQNIVNTFMSDGQSIHILDAHKSENCTQKKTDLYLNRLPIKSSSPLNVADIRIYERTFVIIE